MPDLPRLVRAAGDGNDVAWNQLVRRTEPILRRVLAPMTLSAVDVDDVIQTTWLRVYRGLHTLRDPEAFVGWTIVAARREALHLLQRRAHEVLVEDLAHLNEPGECDVDPTMERVRQDAIRQAVERLPSHQRRLLTWMLEHPDDGYAEISAELAVPIGSIGPTRQRALARLRRDSRLAATVTA
jgi:RNA polymerase sigma factor (sigma-70 family)